MKSYEERELSSALRSLAGTIEVPARDLRRAHGTRSNLATGLAGVALALIVVVAAIAAINNARSAIGNPPPTTPRTPSKSVQTTAVASIPREFAYVDASPGRDVNLWLVDLTGATQPVSVARWSLGSNTFSASRDGKTIIVAAPGETSVIALHLLRPLTGEATILFDGPPGSRVFYPQLSPDGKRYAFTLLGGEGGIWVGDISDGSVHQLHAPVRQDPTLFGWSDDSQWVSYSEPDEADLLNGPHIFLHNVIDGRRFNAGPGSRISWRARDPRVLTALVGGKGNQGAFGAAIYTFDLTSQRRTELLSIDARVEALGWSPARDEFLYLATDTGCEFQRSIWVRSPGAADAKQIGSVQTAQAAWWSSDGGTIYALVAGNGTEGIIMNATTGQTIATIPDVRRTFPCP
jgi:Tol biopolymer transport system component